MVRIQPAQRVHSTRDGHLRTHRETIPRAAKGRRRSPGTSHIRSHRRRRHTKAFIHRRPPPLEFRTKHTSTRSPSSTAPSSTITRRVIGHTVTSAAPRQGARYLCKSRSSWRLYPFAREAAHARYRSDSCSVKSTTSPFGPCTKNLSILTPRALGVPGLDARAKKRQERPRPVEYTRNDTPCMHV